MTNDAQSNNNAKLEPAVQAALDRLKAIVDAERMRFRDPEGHEYPMHVPEPPLTDLFLVFTDPEARRQYKHHVGIQEVQSFGRR